MSDPGGVLTAARAETRQATIDQLVHHLRLRAGRMLCLPCLGVLAAMPERRARGVSDDVLSTGGITSSKVVCVRCGQRRLTVAAEVSLPAPVIRRKRGKPIT